MKILVVDDSEDIRLLIKTTLHAGGFEEVETAASAKEAFRLLGLEPGSGKHQPPSADLILMDIIMPGMDGIEACRTIRASDRYQDTPILMVTAKKDVKDLEIAFDAGAYDYIIKPISRVELMARIRSTMRLKEESDRRKAHEKELERKNRELESALEVIKQMNVKGISS